MRAEVAKNRIKGKELILCQEEMEQARRAGDLVVAEVWAEVKARAEVGWAAHSPQGRAEIVYAPTVATKKPISSGSRAIKKAALNAVRE